MGKKPQKISRDPDRFGNFLAAGKGMAAPREGFERRVMHALSSGVPEAAPRRWHFSRMVALPLAASALFVLALVFTVLRNGGAPADPDMVEVSFTLRHPGAETIALVGDFNRWQAAADTMRRENGSWKITKTLRKGRYYKYAFMVNGTRLVNDDRAGRFVDDGFGGRTSVMFVN